MPQFDDTPYTQLTSPARGDIQGVIKDVSEASAENQTKFATQEDLHQFGSWSSKVRSVTASGSVTISNTDPMFVEINPNGSDRDVSFPAKGDDNHGYFVRHSGSANVLTLKRSGGATITTLEAEEVKYIMPSTLNDFSALTDASGGGGASGLPPTHIYGLKVSNNATDATNDIDVAIGGARDTTNTDDMVLAAALTGKQLDTAWAVGSSAGLLDQGTVANATYHLHLIKRVDTGVVDVIGSLSHDERATVTMTIASPAVVTWGITGNGHGLVAGSPFKFSTTGALPTGVTAGTQYYVIATGLTETTFQFSTSNGGSAVNSSGTQSGVHTGIAGPKLPTNYTLFRRIFSIVRTGAANKPFIHDGDDVSWVTPVNDLSAGNPGISAVTRTLTLPTGIRVNAHISVLGVGNAFSDLPGAIYISDLLMTNSTPSATMFSFKVYVGAGSNDQLGGPVRVFTNRSAQIRSRLEASTAGTSFYIVTHGWTDRRGK